MKIIISCSLISNALDNITAKRCQYSELFCPQLAHNSENVLARIVTMCCDVTCQQYNSLQYHAHYTLLQYNRTHLHKHKNVFTALVYSQKKQINSECSIISQVIVVEYNKR